MNEPASLIPFSINNIIAETINFLLEKKSSLFEELKYPFLGVVVLSLLTVQNGEALNIKFYVSAILSTYLYILIAVKCHRIYLLGEKQSNFSQIFSWHKRNTEFLIATIAMSFILGILSLPIMWILTASLGKITTNNTNINFLGYLAIIPAGYYFARLSLVFPAIAIDNEHSFHLAWEISKGNGLKLFVLILLFPMLTNAGVELLNNGQVTGAVISSALGVVILVFEVILLSKSYQYLINTTKT